MLRISKIYAVAIINSLRPVGSFFDRSRLSLPKLTEIPSRFKTNIAYFQTNYLLVFFVLCLYSALTSPLFLIALIVVALMWLYMMKWRTGPYVIRGWEVPEKATTIGLILGTDLPRCDRYAALCCSSRPVMCYLVVQGPLDACCFPFAE